MFDKYVKNIEAIVSGQDAKTKEWYCKELHTKTIKETTQMIGELNKIYNDYNKANQKEPQKKKDKKDEKDKPPVRM